MQHAPRLNALPAMVLLLAASAAMAEVAVSPRVSLKGDGAVIAFELQSPGDVEVAILNQAGKIVRHLAAGVLGKDVAPPLPLKPGLSQSLIWDGKTDAGEAARGGPFRVRLRAGMLPTFQRMLGESPHTGSVTEMPYRAPVNGLAVDGEGRLVVKMMSSVGSHGNSGMWPWHLRRFDREGKYDRTLMPYPPSTPRDKAAGFDLLPTEKTFAPALKTSLYPVFSALGNEIIPRLAGSAGDQMVFVHSEARELNFLHLDGSNRLRTVTVWPKESKMNCPRWLDIQVALSPDGRYAYYSNVAGTAYDGKTPADIDPNWPQGRIYRQDLSVEGAAPRAFFDLTLPDFARDEYWMPSAWDKKTAAAGIDTDAAGNVFVCDLVNHQVVAIDPQGRKLRTIPISWPDKVLASRKASDVYVISRKVSRGHLPAAMLTKIQLGDNEAKVVAELQLQGTVGGAATLDESGKTPVLWLSGEVSGKHQLLRIEDRGNSLAVTGDDYINRDSGAIEFVGYMDVDPEAELVYVTGSRKKIWRYHGDTGEGGLLPIEAVDVAIGPGGAIYTWGTGSYQGPIARFTRDLKPWPLTGGEGDAHTFGAVYGRAGRGSSVCGMDVDHRGRVYATWGSNDCHVRVYGADGKLVSFPRTAETSEGGKRESIPAAITGVVGYGGSIRVDREGNMYLLQAGVAKDFVAPAGYEKDEAFRQAMGTIYKFPPAGGAIQSRNGNVLSIEGAVASYPGCGPVSRWNAVGSCACTKPRFDVDEYGRLYIPDGITFSVSVRDNAGNEITRFGGYGNFDSRGPASSEPTPAIPLGWPVTAGASDRFIYVGDCLNHRVVCVGKKWASEKTVEIR